MDLLPPAIAARKDLATWAVNDLGTIVDNSGAVMGWVSWTFNVPEERARIRSALAAGNLHPVAFSVDWA